MRTTTTRPSPQGGFTLTDSAIALAIMGALLCLLVPLFMHGTSVSETRAHRNAQELCSICYEAQRAGVNFVVGNEVDPTLRNLLRGGQASSGRSFKASGMSDVEALAASKFLRVEGGSLIVDMTSGS
jgi:type II secretory pathway pseudopilin PulG